MDMDTLQGTLVLVNISDSFPPSHIQYISSRAALLAKMLPFSSLMIKSHDTEN